VPAGPIYSVADMVADPHYQARGMFEQVVTNSRPLKVRPQRPGCRRVAQHLHASCLCSLVDALPDSGDCAQAVRNTWRDRVGRPAPGRAHGQHPPAGLGAGRLRHPRPGGHQSHLCGGIMTHKFCTGCKQSRVSLVYLVVEVDRLLGDDVLPPQDVRARLMRVNVAGDLQRHIHVVVCAGPG